MYVISAVSLGGRMLRRLRKRSGKEFGEALQVGWRIVEEIADVEH